MSTTYKEIIKLIKNKNYEPFLKEFPNYSLTYLREARMHVNLYGVRNKKQLLVNSAYVNFNIPHYPIVYKDKPKNEDYFSEYALEIEFQLAFEYNGKLKVRNYVKVDFLGSVAVIYLEEDLFKVYFKKTQYIPRKAYL